MTSPSRKLSGLDYLAVLRPLLFLPGWTFVCLGYYHSLINADNGFSKDALSYLNIPLFPNIPIILMPSLGLWETLLIYSMLMGAVYIVNQITDAKTDDVNDKLYLVAGGHVKISWLFLEVALLLSASFFLASLWFWERPFYLFFVSLSVVLGIAYSVKPIRLKGRPVLDLLVNAFGYGAIAFAVGWTTRSDFSGEIFLKSLPNVFCVGATFINTTLLDIKGDKAGGDLTTGALLGVKKSCVLSTLQLAAAGLASLILKEYVVSIATLFCLPLFAYMTATRRLSVIKGATKFGILFLSLLACLVIPLYFFLLFGAILSVRWYYAARFGIKYP